MNTGKHETDTLDAQVRRTLFRATLLFTLALGLLGAGLWALPRGALAASDACLRRGEPAAARFFSRFAPEEERAGLGDRAGYLEAMDLMDRGDYDAAAAAFRVLGDWGDAAGQALRCQYLKAQELLEAGETLEAAAAFQDLIPYADAEQKRKLCLYRQAEALLEAGETLEAALLFDSLGDWEDAPERTLALAREITGEAEADSAMAALRGLTPEALERQRLLAEKRRDLPAGRIAVGFAHTLGLRDDGTVLACGDDGFGQCQVESWTGVRAVAAGAYHSVALCADGTVRAVGRNSEGQCAVENWTDIVQIAAADYATLGLRSDGTLVWAGLNGYEELAAYENLSAVSGGSYAAAVLLPDGSAVLSHETEGAERLTDLIALDVNTGYALGLREDGTAVSTAQDLDAWKDIVAVSAGSTGAMGLDMDGRVFWAPFRAGGGPDFSGVEDAAAIAAGGSHWAVLLADGRVRVFGDNSSGQAETAGWRLLA